MGLTESYWPADTRETVLDLTVGDVLRRAAEEVPQQIGLVAGMPGGRRTWSYAELVEQAERAATALVGRFQPGERVAVWAPNVPQWVILEFAAAMAGVVLVTVNPAFRQAELSYVLEQSRSAGVFFVPEFRGNPMAESLDRARRALPDLREAIRLDRWDEFVATGSPGERLPSVSPDDVAQIQYTSGTTGFPKGSLLHHRGITNNARFCAERLEVGRGEVWINPMPLFHTGGCVLGALGAAWSLATHVPVLAFDPGLVLDLVEQQAGNVLGGVPTMLIALMEHPDRTKRDLSSLRAVISGGSTVPAELVRRIEATLGVRVCIVFGQTEASPVITQTRLGDSLEDKAQTIGQALPRTEVKVVDPASGVTVAPGQVGELCTRGYLVMKGYFEMDAATAETIDAQGWLHTGDLCSMDERGYCRVEGRLKEMIIRGGENIYPREIEELLFTHPAVGDVAVIGVPDERWGEQVAAFVRLAPDQQATEDELRSFVRDRLAPHKAPRHWVFVADFPLTPSGKVQKYVLREQFEHR